jgi:hypothetical protein
MLNHRRARPGTFAALGELARTPTNATISVHQLAPTLSFSVVQRTPVRPSSILALVHTHTRSHTSRARVANSSVLVVADGPVVSRSKLGVQDGDDRCVCILLGQYGLAYYLLVVQRNQPCMGTGNWRMGYDSSLIEISR